jgi:cellulose synthase/poly-beta-1,6-N-acetylglucosamine synthase-like glycosyltransferase
VRYISCPTPCYLLADPLLVFLGSGIQIIIVEWALDNDFIRFALLATVPLVFCIALFFCIQIVNTVSVVIGPVAQLYQNSKYYSATPPPAPPKGDQQELLPHVTIQMPVYKESLEQTIAPSIESIKKAMQTYARQGGTSSIMVNDDGLQLLSEEDREIRTQFYANQDIAWVARPPHGQDGFVRAGRFKKASNMNYGLALSIRMEEILLELQADKARNPFGDEDEVDIEERALQMAVDETNGQAWAKGGRQFRIGEIILIVDSDTQVPEDCFRDAARELQESPNVAVIQHSSDGESCLQLTSNGHLTTFQSCRSPITTLKTPSRTSPVVS